MTTFATSKPCAGIAGSDNLQAPEAQSIPVQLAKGQEAIITGTVAEAQQLMKLNKKFFLLKCYPNLARDIPDFHCELLTAMQDVAMQYLVCVCPRGFAKTMIARAAAAEALCSGYSPFVTIINRNAKDAINSTNVVWSIVKSEFFQQLYGRVEVVAEREGVGEYIYKQNGQFRVLLARGRDSKVQGMNVHNMRPNLIIMDDIEQAEDNNETETYEDTKRWFFETIFFLMDEDNKRVIYIGNMNKKESLIATLPGMTDWHSIILSAIKDDGTALWPDRFPLDKLLREFQQYREAGLQASWLAQKMSRIDDDAENCIISVSEMDYHTGLLPADIEYGVITIDPAISDSARADECVITVHGWYNNAWNKCECYHKTGVDAMQLIRRAINMAVKWGVRLICVESIAYQKALIPLFDAELSRMVLKNTIVVKPLVTHKSKDSRIIAWISMLRNKLYRVAISDSSLLTQLKQYRRGNKNQHDDIIDCCAMIIQATQMYRHLMRKVLVDPFEEELRLQQKHVMTGYDAMRNELGIKQSDYYDSWGMQAGTHNWKDYH